MPGPCCGNAGTLRNVSPPTGAGVLAHLPPELDVAVVRDGPRTIVAAGAADVIEASGADAFLRLDALASGWWAGFATFELGRAVERVRARAGSARGESEGAGEVRFVRFDARLVLAPDRAPEVVGDGAAASALIAAAEGGSPRVPLSSRAAPHWHSSLDRVHYERGVRDIVELIEAGDCYQVNLTRRLTVDVAVDGVQLFGAIEREHPAPHASFLRVAGPGAPITVVSASPERFLRWEGREIETRPIKGTARDPVRLRASAKDRAENVMIVDLARNDLGRVCVPGSIDVPSLCAVEAHPGLHHLVSTVRGRLCDDVGTGALLRATFPPASVTGAPKPRVLQAIEDLEPVDRGVYCGALGWIDAEHERGDLAVAIRTFTVSGGRTHFGVGAGIVADSEPSAEWDETELKANRLLGLAVGHRLPTVLAS
jgi:para-aminobenzoate synthetase component 1